MKTPKPISAILLILTLCAGQALAQPAAWPETPAGKLGKQWLEAFNSGDRARLAAFARDHYSEQQKRGRSPEEIAEGLVDFRENVGGGFDLRKVLKSDDTYIEVIFRERGEMGGFAKASLKIDPAKPELIGQLAMRPTHSREASLLKPAGQLGRELDVILTRLAAADKFSGAVLIAKDGKPIFQKAYGLANRKTRTANTLNTRFRLGSMPKMFTSVAIAQLVQQGKLKYTDTLDKLLPDFPNQEAAKKITVHHLLTHTSGLGDIFGPEFNQRKNELKRVKDYLPLFATKPLQFEPGQGWEYSNGGFIVLGVIIERLSGMSYYDYLDQHVFAPAGMKDTGSFPKDQKVERLAVGYMRDGDKLVSNYETLPWRGMSAGGADSTVGDMLRFAEALRSGKLVDAELAKTITSAQTTLPGGAEYGYGFGVDEVDGTRVVGHGGGAPGMNGQLDVYWDSGYTVVALANLDPPAAQRITDWIRNRLAL